ncbi:MAG: pilus assembly protein TadG-related protein [Pseudomonadota bacterium]
MKSKTEEEITRPTLSDLLFVSRFARNEDGVFTVFGLIVVLMMVVAGGVALDIMRSEVDRTTVQNTVDRAVLAAASTKQTATPEDVVEAYLRAAGVPKDSVIIDVPTPTTSTGSIELQKTVNVTAKANTIPLFMNVLGTDELTVPVSASAEEVVSELEVSLVVDISGSMRGDKIASLRTEAKKFVAELLKDREDRTTISIVPYNDRVNVGSDLAAYFPLSSEHSFSNCVVFDAADFNTTSLTSGTILERMGHFDRDSGNANAPGLVPDPLCRSDGYGSILAWSNDVTELQGHIDLLGASDWTAMDLGVKWGTLLLDPTTRTQMQAMMAGKKLKLVKDANGDYLDTSNFGRRPYNYTEPGMRKVLVVMTDGRNTTQWDLKDDKKSGPSGVFVYNEFVSPPGLSDSNATTAGDLCADGTGSLYGLVCNGGTFVSATLANSNGNSFFNGRSAYSADYRNIGELLTDFAESVGTLTLTSGGETVSWEDAWWRHSTRGNWTAFDAQGDYNGDGSASMYEARYSTWSEANGKFFISHLDEYWDEPYGGTDAVELTYSELFATMSIKYIDFTLLNGADWDTRDKYYFAWHETHNQTKADTNLSNICAAARQQGVTIYTIAFQAPDDGETAMKDCAGIGNEGYYFDVAGLDIKSAFDDILASLDRLRLID